MATLIDISPYTYHLAVTVLALLKYFGEYLTIIVMGIALLTDAGMLVSRHSIEPLVCFIMEMQFSHLRRRSEANTKTP